MAVRAGEVDPAVGPQAQGPHRVPVVPDPGAIRSQAAQARAQGVEDGRVLGMPSMGEVKPVGLARQQRRQRRPLVLEPPDLERQGPPEVDHPQPLGLGFGSFGLEPQLLGALPLPDRTGPLGLRLRPSPFRGEPGLVGAGLLLQGLALLIDGATPFLVGDPLLAAPPRCRSASRRCASARAFSSSARCLWCDASCASRSAIS